MPAPDSVYSCCLATRQSDDDEAFALARIQPFQLGCRGTASAGAAAAPAARVAAHAVFSPRHPAAASALGMAGSPLL